jgi:hypothetical protein
MPAPGQNQTIQHVRGGGSFFRKQTSWSLPKRFPSKKSIAGMIAE